MAILILFTYTYIYDSHGGIANLNMIANGCVVFFSVSQQTAQFIKLYQTTESGLLFGCSINIVNLIKKLVIHTSKKQNDGDGKHKENIFDLKYILIFFVEFKMNICNKYLVR